MNVRQLSLIFPCFALLLPAASGLLGGCGDSAATGGGSADGGGSSVPASCEGVDVSGCSVVLGPLEGDDTTQLQGALIEDVKSGDTLCLCPGTYDLNNEVQVSTPELTIRGVGASRDDVVLDFAGQIGGDDGLTATTDGFTVENFSVKNSPGNGIVVTGAENVTFRNLHVYWRRSAPDDREVRRQGCRATQTDRHAQTLARSESSCGRRHAGRRSPQ